MVRPVKSVCGNHFNIKLTFSYVLYIFSMFTLVYCKLKKSLEPIQQNDLIFTVKHVFENSLQHYGKKMTLPKRVTRVYMYFLLKSRQTNQQLTSITRDENLLPPSFLRHFFFSSPRFIFIDCFVLGFVYNLQIPLVLLSIFTHFASL